MQALEEAKRNHEKREIRMTQEMTEVLNDRACGAAALEELQKDHAALMEDCQSLKVPDPPPSLLCPGTVELAIIFGDCLFTNHYRLSSTAVGYPSVSVRYA